ncbi:discoidin domain-containing protein [Streptomyces sp. NPDC005566]|uniref:discoidin domain-containing protein n=1 Tax=Streptomyces sp. NPDC005566 TaxID=3156886 RepID=UPI0033B97EB3
MRLGRGGRTALCFAAAALPLTLALPATALGQDRHAPVGGAQPAGESAKTDPWHMATDTPDDAYDAHPYVGNGYFSQRIPAKGMGYYSSGGPTGSPLYTPRYDGSQVAGLFAKQGADEFAAALPTWSTLDFATDGQGKDSYAAAPNSTLTSYRQELDVRRALVTTSTSWLSVTGRTTDLTYEVLADRERAHVGAVRLTVTPRWSGTASVTDLLDGAGARRLKQTSAGFDSGTSTAHVSFVTDGNNIAGTLASTLTHSERVRPESTTATAPHDLTAGQRVAFPVTAGHSYEFTKFVGTDTEQTSNAPQRDALKAATAAAGDGWDKILAEHTNAWAKLWDAGVTVPGQDRMQGWLNGSYYSLLSSVREGQSWSLAPTGLTSDTYAGQVYWDADTWMFPALLAGHPELAKSIVDYRYRTLGQAKRNAAGGGFKGALYPWTSALTGDCTGVGPCYGTQAHLQSDIALSQWQYFQATGDKTWLKSTGWPVIKALAQFWASRVAANNDGSYSVRGVAGADEYSHGDDNVSTNAGAATTLKIATEAAAALGSDAPAQWSTIAGKLRIPLDSATDTHPEYEGYAGQKVKQADTVLMQYPYNWPMPKTVARNDLNYFAARTDPEGPAMTDSVHMIAAAAIGDPGCVAYTYLLRSVQPFIREPYAQFSEARGDKAGDNAGAPAFTFLTGAGGFLQTFPYGLAGLRWGTDSLRLAPTLPPQLSDGVRISEVKWQGRELSITIGPKATTVTLNSGPSMTIETPDGKMRLSHRAPVRLATARPDLDPTGNIARCKSATSDSAESGYYPAAAVDGNSSTAWVAEKPQADLTVDLGSTQRVAGASVSRAGKGVFGYEVQTSPNGRTWTTRQTVEPRAGADRIRFSAVNARFVRLHFTGADGSDIPRIAEFAVGGGRYAATVEVEPAQDTTEVDKTTTVVAKYTNLSRTAAHHVKLALEVPDSWKPTPQGADTFEKIAPGATVDVEWQIAAPADAAPGESTLAVTAVREQRGQTVTDRATATLTVVDPCTPGETCEAEKAALTGSGGVNTDHKGYTGAGFVDGLLSAGAGFITQFNAPTAGRYTLAIRYANSLGGAAEPYEAKTRTMTLAVPGASPITVSFPVTANWDTWSTAEVTVDLPEGLLPIGLTCTGQSDGAVNIDSWSLKAL